MNPQQTRQIPLTSFSDFVCDAPANVKLSPLIEMMSKVDREQLPRCGSREFEMVTRLKTYKGMLSNGQLIIGQVQVWRCVNCGAIHDLNAKQ